MKWLSWFRPNRMLLLLIGAGLSGICYFWPQDTQPSGLTPSVPVPPIPSPMPKGYQPNSKMRDPFTAAAALPVSATEIKPSSALSVLPKQPQPVRITGEKPAPESAVPILSGIVSGRQTKMAIITYQGSRSYAVNDTVGKWVVMAIDDDSVTLMGPAGQEILRLGR